MAIVVGRNWGVEKLPKKPGRFEIKIINQRKLTCSFSKRLDKVSPAIFSLHPLILNLVYYSFNKLLTYRRERQRQKRKIRNILLPFEENISKQNSSKQNDSKNWQRKHACKSVNRHDAGDYIIFSLLQRIRDIRYFISLKFVSFRFSPRLR